MHLSFKKKTSSFCSDWGKDTRDVAEEVLVLEVPLLADPTDGFQEERLPPRPLVLQQDDDVAQRHVVPAVREGSQLRARRRGSRGARAPQHTAPRAAAGGRPRGEGQRRTGPRGKWWGGAQPGDLAPQHPVG